MKINLRTVLLGLTAVCLTACAPFLPGSAAAASPQPTVTVPVATPSSKASETPIAAVASAAALPAKLPLLSRDWQTWPVVPGVTQNIRDIYVRGQAQGNDPHAFSVFGDCQSVPDVFMGYYETDPQAVSQLPADLQEVVTYFTGSFNRESPTVKPGTNAGSLLWEQWHQNKLGCVFTETPVDCELRLHHPSFVFITVGTHYEARNVGYLTKILDELVAKGVVPILATKADNREVDGRINHDMAVLAVKYNLPLWNFWAATVDLPNKGLYTKPSEPNLGDIYLDEGARAIHSLTALETLNVVWRAAAAK